MVSVSRHRRHPASSPPTHLEVDQPQKVGQLVLWQEHDVVLHKAVRRVVRLHQDLYHRLHPGHVLDDELVVPTRHRRRCNDEYVERVSAGGSVKCRITVCCPTACLLAQTHGSGRRQCWPGPARGSEPASCPAAATDRTGPETNSCGLCSACARGARCHGHAQLLRTDLLRANFPHWLALEECGGVPRDERSVRTHRSAHRHTPVVSTHALARQSPLVLRTRPAWCRTICSAWTP